MKLLHKNVFLLFLLGLTFVQPAFSQAGMEFISSMDTTAGNFTQGPKEPKVKNVYVSPNHVVFDDDSGVYYFTGTDSLYNRSFYGINVRTNKTIYNKAINTGNPGDNIAEMVFNSADRKLYALSWDIQKQKEYFGEIKLDSGIFEKKRYLEGVRSIIGNCSFINEIEGTYHFYGIDSLGSKRYYSVDISTGIVLSSPIFPVANINMTVHGMVHHPGRNRVYALLYDIQRRFGGIYLLDSQGSGYTLIDSIPGYTASVNFMQLQVDPDADRFFFIGMDRSEPYYYTYYNLVLNSNGGLNVNKFDYPVLCNPQDNFLKLRYSKKDNRFYGLNWTYWTPRKLEMEVCKAATIYVPAPHNAIWSSGDTGYLIKAKREGVYTYRVNTTCYGNRLDTLILRFKRHTRPIVYDTGICIGSYFRYDVNVKGSYSWFKDGKSEYFMQDTGLYVLNWTDTNLCNYNDTLRVHLRDGVKPMLGNDTSLCIWGQFQLKEKSAYPFKQLKWLSTNVSSNGTVLDPGDVVLQATDLQGCDASDTLRVNSKGVKPELGNEDSVCAPGGNYTLRNQTSYRFSQYLWSNVYQSESFNIMAPYNVILRTIDSNGCSNSDTLNVKFLIYTTPVFTPKGARICDNDTFAYTLKDFRNVRWENGDTSHSVVFNKAGSYTFQAWNEGECLVEDSIVLLRKNKETLDLGPDLLMCKQSQLTLKNLSSSNFNRFFWNGSSGGDSYNVSQPGTYILRALDNDQCYTEDTVLVSLYPDLTPVFTNQDTILCRYNDVDPELKNADHYSEMLWNYTSYLHEHLKGITKRYKFYDITDTNNCQYKSQRFTIRFRILEGAEANIDEALCLGDTFRFKGKLSDATYLWSDSYNGLERNLNTASDYQVKITEKGCDSVFRLKLSFDPKPDVGISFLSDCKAGSVTLDAGNAEAYEWENSNVDVRTYQIFDPGMYYVQKKNLGCLIRDSIHVTDIPSIHYYYVPDMFTPNGDALNETFYYFIPLGFQSMTIYNRWGVIVFKTDDPNIQWDGNFNNQACPQDVYNVVIRSVNCHGESVLDERKIILIR